MDNTACCCPSRAVVRVLMPPTQDRPRQVDLLLCGHHFRLSQSSLESAGAEVTVLPGTLTENALVLL